MAVNPFAAVMANVLPQLNQMIPNLMNNLNAQNGMQQNPLTALLNMQVNNSAPIKDDKHMRSVFVGNIPYETTDDDIKNIFSQVGQVLSFRMVHDRETGKPKGYGFCEFKDAETAQCAIRNLNGIELHGRTLRVDSAASEKGREELKVDTKVESTMGSSTVVNTDDAPQFITNLISSLPPEHIFELLQQMKTCIHDHPDESRQLLYNNPQLSYALLQALVVLKCIDSNEAQSILYKSRPENPPQQLIPMGFGVPLQGNMQTMVVPPNQPNFPNQETPPTWIPPAPQEPINPEYNNSFQPGFVPPHQPPHSNRYNSYHDNHHLTQRGKYDYPPNDYRGPPSGSGWQQDYHDDRHLPPPPSSYDHFNPHDDFEERERGRHFQGDPRKNRGNPPPLSRHDEYPRSSKHRSDPRSHNSSYENPRDMPHPRDNDNYRDRPPYDNPRSQDSRSNQNDPRSRSYSGPPPSIHNQPPAPSVSEDEKKQIINQVMSLNDQQLASLPEEERRNIMILREQISRGILP